MQTLNPLTWKWDFAKLPADVQLAILGQPGFGSFTRLTETHFLFRPAAGSGPHYLLSISEVSDFLLSLPIAQAYVRPPAKSDPLADLQLDNLLDI